MFGVKFGPRYRSERGKGGAAKMKRSGSERSGLRQELRARSVAAQGDRTRRFRQGVTFASRHEVSGVGIGTYKQNTSALLNCTKPEGRFKSGKQDRDNNWIGMKF
jgi:hypothetical protein